jgi:hypothetical protein
MGFDRMLVNGRWLHGRSSQIMDDVDPYTKDVQVRIPFAEFTTADWVLVQHKPVRYRF